MSLVLDHDIKFGDIADDKGNILCRNPTDENPDGVGLLQHGSVLVTPEQAKAARPYGWVVLVGIRADGLIEVTRGMQKH